MDSTSSTDPCDHKEGTVRSLIMLPVIPIALVFVGCCSNVVFLEQIIKVYPHSGNAITFCAFVFNCLEGFFFTTKFFTKRSAIPVKTYYFMVAFFFVVQTLNNYTLGFNIAMPLHMIIRSGSLLSNLMLGVIILDNSYKPYKYVSVLIITFGIIVCTVSSGFRMEKTVSHTGDDIYDYMVWFVGLFLMIVSLFLSSGMGIYQEQTYATYGKHPSEALFYNHFLPLPAFLLLAPDIYRSFSELIKSDPYTISYIGITVPWAMLWLLLTTVTQFVCIKSVFILTTECSSLTVTLVVTLRKFVSLAFSIIYFQNQFTPTHWIGTFLVFMGTLMFLGAFKRFRWFQQMEEALHFFEIMNSK